MCWCIHLKNLLYLFELFSWEHEKVLSKFYSYCFKSKDKNVYVEFVMGKGMTNTMKKFFNTCFNFNRFFSRSHLKNDVFYFSLQKCSGESAGVLLSKPMALSMSFKFWWIVQTHTECVPLVPSGLHHLWHKFANFKKPILFLG